VHKNPVIIYRVFYFIKFCFKSYEMVSR